MTFKNATLRPANTEGAFILDNEGDEQLLFVEDLGHLRDLIDQLLPRTPHNHDANDPGAHVLFAAVCCGAQLYRCSVVREDQMFSLPAKPIIHQGENECRRCGHVLLPF